MSIPESTSPTRSIASATDAAARSRGLTFGDRLVHALVTNSALIVLVAIVAVFSILNPGAFLSSNNVQNIFVQAAAGGVVALALTVTMIIGEFDLSIGYMSSLAGILFFWFMVDHGTGLLTAVVPVLLIAGCLGLVSGLVVAKLKVNAFVGTLGVGFVAVGLNYQIGGGATIAGEVPGTVSDIGLGKTLGISNLSLIWLLVAVILWIATERTRTGVHMRAVGGSSRAAGLAGLHVARIRLGAFVASAMLAALGGMMLASRLGSGEPAAGDGYLLDSFAATFLGRGFYRPGEFNVAGTVVGVLILQCGYSGLAIIGMPTSARYFFAGLILIVALALGAIAGRSRATD